MHSQAIERWVFPVPGWAQEDDVVFGHHEVQGAEIGDDVSFEAALMIEVEVLDGLAGGETGRSDPMLVAMILTGGDLPFQIGDQELLVAPLRLTGPFRQLRAGRVPQAPRSDPAWMAFGDETATMTGLPSASLLVG